MVNRRLLTGKRQPFCLGTPRKAPTPVDGSVFMQMRVLFVLNKGKNVG
jgi:hypothetical protein